MTQNPVTASIEGAALDLLRLAVSWVGKEKAADLLMQAAEEQAKALEDAKFGPEQGTGR